MLNGSTSVVYTPPADATQPVVATFSYRAMDAKGLKSEPATVTINVAPNQAPLPTRTPPPPWACL